MLPTEVVYEKFFGIEAEDHFTDGLLSSGIVELPVLHERQSG